MVPLKSDSGVIGAISITREEPGAFADKDKELLHTFADQAVIAIQNVELFNEVQVRTRELTPKEIEQRPRAEAHSEYKQTISTALSALTGKSAPPNAKAWRDALAQPEVKAGAMR